MPHADCRCSSPLVTVLATRASERVPVDLEGAGRRADRLRRAQGRGSPHRGRHEPAGVGRGGAGARDHRARRRRRAGLSRSSRSEDADRTRTRRRAGSRSAAHRGAGRPATREDRHARRCTPRSIWSSGYYGNAWDYWGYGWATVYPIGKAREQRTLTVETLLYDLSKGAPIWAAVSQHDGSQGRAELHEAARRRRRQAPRSRTG